MRILKIIISLFALAVFCFLLYFGISGGYFKRNIDEKKGERPNDVGGDFFDTIKVELGKNKITSKEDLLDNLQCKNCNLVIVSLTNTRKDHVGIYGYERDATPNIDKFFKNSLIFTNAFAPASWTLPVSASFFTSTFPYTHGIMDRYDGSRLSDDYLTLTEILKQNGYKTAGFTGGGDYNRDFNVAQSFDFYLDENNYSDYSIEVQAKADVKRAAYLSIEKLVPLAIDWLKNNKKEKKFLLLQGFDTHCPFTPKEPFKSKFLDGRKSDIDFSNCLWTFEQTDPITESGKRFWPLKTWYTDSGINDLKITDEDLEYMISLYDGEIAQADSYLEPFFEAVEKMGLDKNTVFIFMAEHGDLFGEHGRFMRGGPLKGTFYDPVINFPILIKHPNINKPVIFDSLVQTVDFMPTLLDVLGLEDGQKEKRQGKNIIKNANEYVYSASEYNAANNAFFSGLSNVEVIRSLDWKLIKEEIFDLNTNKKTVESYELYDIKNDPGENNNLYKEDDVVVSDLRKKLDEYGKRYSN